MAGKLLPEKEDLTNCKLRFALFNLESKARRIVFIRLDDGSSPFEDWLNSVKDSLLVGLDGEYLVVLLGGGDKSTQDKDIENAKYLWRKYKNEN